MTPAENQARRYPDDCRLGAGRSGIVFRLPGDAGGERAVKVFQGEGLAQLVHYVFFGAPNPYRWNEAAIRCAYLRRRLLAVLIPYWFGSRLRVANALDWRWNESFQAYELHTEFVAGRNAALHQPFAAGRATEIDQLVRGIMRPLQARLLEAGFDGLVWQAGRGNPVAANNFLRLDTDAENPAWVCIDLESGVPALFSHSPLQWFGFYLPLCFKHRRPLFDDVDSTRLAGYLCSEATALRSRLGESGYAQLLAWQAELAQQQAAWKSLSRAHSSIQYALSRRRITEAQALWYRQRVPLWYAREAGRAAVTAVRKAATGLRAAARWLRDFRYRQAWRALLGLAMSQRYRAIVARWYLATRIEVWERRRQLEPADGRRLLRMLSTEEDSAYLTDFGMHIALKPFVRVVNYGLILPLTLLTLLHPLVLVVAIAAGGAIARSLYTFARLLQAAARGRPKPWVALLVGTLPVIGNAAYPMQILHAGAGRASPLAQFIIYDAFTRVGELLPIWGGRDTQTEHLFNHMADRLIRLPRR
jgi:hypothetical protein